MVQLVPAMVAMSMKPGVASTSSRPEKNRTGGNEYANPDKSGKNNMFSRIILALVVVSIIGFLTLVVLPRI